MGGPGSGGYRENAGRKRKKALGQASFADHISKRQREEEEAKAKEEAEKKKKEIQQQKEQQRKEKQQSRNQKVEKEWQERKEREESEQEKDLDRLEASIEETINNRNLVGSAGGGDGGGGDGDDDDEDYFSDDDYDTDPARNELDKESGEDTDGQTTTKRRSRLKYSPPKDSVLRKYLDEMKAKITHKKYPKYGQSWFPPTCIAIEKNADPSNFYKELPTIYLFAPFKSRKLPTGIDSFNAYTCVHCNFKGHLESNGWYYRPQHNFDNTVWLLHQRLRCQDGKGGCGKTFATFHPKLMKQFPNVIIERFPFLTTVSGIGIHIAMMNQFLVLATKGVLFSTYCNSVNEAKQTRYFRDHATYLDLLADRVSNDELEEERRKDGQTSIVDYVDNHFVPKPFAPYKSAGEYNGIPLKPSLMRRLFLKVMKTFETYMQESFQMHPDESESSDHSFKFAKQIVASNRAGSAYQATYDSISLSGMCTFNRFCHTKSNDELFPLIELYKKVRINSGATELKRTEGDGGGDRSLWPIHFPELNNNIKPYRPLTQNGLPRRYLEDDEYLVLSSKDEVNNWAGSVAQILSQQSNCDRKLQVHYGFDAEWNVDVTRDITRVFSFCFVDIIFGQAVVMDLTKMGWFSIADVPVQLKNLLENPRLVPVGVQVGGDVARIRKLGINIKTKKELSQLAKDLEPSNDQPNTVQNLAGRYLKYYVDKSSQNSDWKQLQHRKELQEYAALDAKVHLELYLRLMALLRTAEKEGRIPSKSIIPGNKIQLTLRKKVCATGEMIFVGGDKGESRRWGTQFVGKGKCLVRIDRVTSDSARPVFSYRKSPDNQPYFLDSWENKNSTLKKLLEDQKQLNRDLIISWPTDRIKLFMPAIEPFVLPPADEVNIEEEANENIEENANVSTTSNGEKADTNEITNADDVPINATVDLNDENDVGVEDGVYCPRIRMIIDRFHVFDSMPASRDSEKKALLKMIRRLVIQATIEFDLDDWNDVTRFLSEKRGIPDLEGLLDHFHFEREWWYQHVRVYPPPPDRGAANLQTVMDFVEKNETLKPVFEMLRDWFESIILLYKEGKLSESNDVEMYQYDGTDKHGLNKWLRRRGSNRSENIHQKMRVAFGPHGVGAEVGHYLLLLVCYRYNINTGIRRKGYCNFGTMHYNLIDRIQLRMMQIFQRDVFPNHNNQSLFKPIKNFVAVGIGPLNYNEGYVEEGAPHLHLRGDIKFLAEKMKLKGPPLHIYHPREKEIFNKYMGEHPKPSGKGWEELAKIFLKEADYEHVFPKLPSMLQNYYNKWKHTNQLVSLQDNIKVKYYDLLKKLGQPPGAKEGGADAVLNPAAEFQKKRSDENRLQQMTASDEAGVDAVLPDDADMETMNVAPLQAPDQTQYVASRKADGRKRGTKRCSGAPFGCPLLADDCCEKGWQDWRKCKLIEGKSNLVNVPDSVVEQKKLIKKYRDEQNLIRVHKFREKQRAAAAATTEEEEETTT